MALHRVQPVGVGQPRRESVVHLSADIPVLLRSFLADAIVTSLQDPRSLERRMWEIYAYQNADSLFGIFNAAATIHGSGDYMAAVAAVAFCGFIAALVAYAFAPEKLQGWKWLATVLLVFSVLIVPRVTVGVVDKTGGSAVKVVANVPFGVAFLGSVTSTVGHTLTGLFETAFQVIPGVGALPSELSYEKNGLMFGNRLIRETGSPSRIRTSARIWSTSSTTARCTT
jgi:uncharacterized membrane protein YiaA